MQLTIREAISEAFGVLSPTQKIILIAAVLAVVGVALFGGSLVSSFKIRKLEREVTAAKDDAKRWEEAAAKREAEAAAYKEKIDYLEGNLTEARSAARKQDEILEKQQPVIDGARAGVRTARERRQLESTDADLCLALEDVGHPCGPR